MEIIQDLKKISYSLNIFLMLKRAIEEIDAGLDGSLALARL